MILVTGATGYVGGRLLAALAERGLPVRCMVRRPERLRSRVGPGTEVVRGDVTDPASLAAALEGVTAAYYLIHSMGSSGGFSDLDREAAETFGRAARAAGVGRIVYLGGLGEGDDLSEHLASRQEVGRILRESGVVTVELRASIIIGSGSLSFEMVRALVERLPVMVTPRWTRTLAQPIGIEDVVDCLVAALDVKAEESRIIEIGGADRISYLGLMREFARQRGLVRLIIPVPVLSPYLSSLWLSLVTPIFARVGRKLIDGVRNETVVRDGSGMRELGVRPRSIEETIARALRNEDKSFAATRWSDAVSSGGPIRGFGGVKFGNRLVDSRSRWVPVPPREAFRPIRRIGGTTGWYYGNWLWRLRGVMDALLGGPGLRRGRRDPERLVVGDTLDFWRVEEYEPDRRLRLAAEMRLPGRAWLEFEVIPEGGGSRVRQTAIFDPVGLSGLLYWYGVYPLHFAVFNGMLEGVARHAGRRGRAHGSDEAVR